MHTAWHRVNAVLTYFATIAAALCALTALADVLVSPKPVPGEWPPAKLAVREVRRLAVARGKHDQALLGGISLDADLRRAFNWNTKQLFVTLRAEYSTPKNTLNQVVLWDAVVASRPAAHLKLPDLKQEYPFLDQGNGLRGNKVNLTLAWHVMPRVGALREGFLTFPGAVVMPEEYTAVAAAAAAGGGGGDGAGAAAATRAKAEEQEEHEEDDGLEVEAGEEEDDGEDEYGED